MKKESKVNVLINAGFKQCDNKVEYELRLNSTGDRFNTVIFYDIESDEFYYGRTKLSGFKELTKEEIMCNHNELHTSSKEHFIEVEKELSANGIILP